MNKKFKIDANFGGGFGLQIPTEAISSITLIIAFHLWRNVVTDKYECTDECGNKTLKFIICDQCEREIVKTKTVTKSFLSDTSWADKYKQNPK